MVLEELGELEDFVELADEELDALGKVFSFDDLSMIVLPRVGVPVCLNGVGLV